MMVRLFLFLLVATALYLGVWWVFLPAAALYIWQYRGFELFFLGLVIDGYFGQFYTWPYYATALLLLIVVVNFIKPHVLFYNE